MSSTPATPSEGSPSMVTRKVGAGIQARLAKLQGATGTPVITREIPKKFLNGYGTLTCKSHIFFSAQAHYLVNLDDPFRERLDGTLRRSLSGTWSVADTSATSTDGSHTLVDFQSSTALPALNEKELKRRQDFTKNWEKEQLAGMLINQRHDGDLIFLLSSCQPTTVSRVI
jgi:hypothetical protein